MSEITASPAPWEVVEDEDGSQDLVILSSTIHTVALVSRCYQGERIPKREKLNARLICAAPDLLAALIALDECYCEAGNELSKSERHQHRLVLIDARAAIAKATGQVPA